MDFFWDKASVDLCTDGCDIGFSENELHSEFCEEGGSVVSSVDGVFVIPFSGSDGFMISSGSCSSSILSACLRAYGVRATDWGFGDCYQRWFSLVQA